MSSSHQPGSKSTGYIAVIGPLNEIQFKELVKKGLINRDTEVSKEKSKKWVAAREVQELCKYFGKTPTPQISILDRFRSLYEDLEKFVFQSLHGERIEIPEQLGNTLNDELNKGTEEVILTTGKINGVPAFIVVSMSKEEPEILAEIEIDTSQWEPKSIQISFFKHSFLYLREMIYGFLG